MKKKNWIYIYQKGSNTKAKVEWKGGNWIIVYMSWSIPWKFKVLNHNIVLHFIDTCLCAYIHNVFTKIVMYNNTHTYILETEIYRPNQRHGLFIGREKGEILYGKKIFAST